MESLLSRYEDFHQMMLLADGRAVEFDRRMGFERTGKTDTMWIYDGSDH